MRTVPLHGVKAAGRFALIDDEDYELVMQYRWHIWDRARPGCRLQGPYAQATVWTAGESSKVRMHNLIMGCKGIDHANHDGLDNQRSNLRVAVGNANHANTRPRKGSTSTYKGVSWHKASGKWRAQIAGNGVNRALGYYTSQEVAAHAYDAAAREVYGQFAYLNFPHQTTR